MKVSLILVYSHLHTLDTEVQLVQGLESASKAVWETEG